tara:strand:+ start:488 stop:811 length:324 start_codon:yes stop_codon:yes gene_type:complete
MNSCTVTELHTELTGDAKPLLLDVRTAEELTIAHIEDARHIPLDALPMRLDELDAWRDKDIVCMCHHGMRSAHAQQILLSNGFTKVRNLTGGIHAWSVSVDPQVAQY